MFKLWSGRFVRARIDHVALGVQGPESVSENVGGVVPFLDFAKPVPVLSETGFGALRRFVAAQKLVVHRWLVQHGRQQQQLTLGNGPPKETRSSVSDIHL